jgi:hypothetical protein
MRFTEDFHKVSAFLKRMEINPPATFNFDWVRWEWAVSHPYLDETQLDKIGIWENDTGEIVGLATYENRLGEAFLITDPAYSALQEEMLRYAITNLCDGEGKIRVYIDDNDRELQRLARANGLKPSQQKDHNAVIEVTDDLSYTLPEGFSIVSMADECDYAKIHDVMWKGFNHGDDVPHTDEEHEMRRILFSGPNQRHELKIITKAPNGEYCSFSGAWYDPVSQTGQIEPVCTDPKYRKMGLGKAAVLEGVIRCGKLGAKRVYVGSPQQFYYNIGFDPVGTYTAWSNA